VVVVKSTVPVGTNRQVAEAIRKARPDADFDIASNPEFLREGAAIDDFMRPDRVVVGVESDRAAEVMAEVYRPLFLREFPIVTTSLESAEMIKYAANAFLATKITFINEIAALCEATGADVKSVAKGMGLDNRIGRTSSCMPGPGYGGSCFPKDTRALARIGQEHGTPMRITETVIEVNEAMKRRMIEKLRELLRRVVQRQDDRGAGRDLQAQYRRHARGAVADHRARAGRRRRAVRVTDPQGRREGEALLPGVTWAEDAYAAADGADAVVILTEWNEFRALDLKRITRCGPRVLADLRNIYDAETAAEAGFSAYAGVGR
jgi:UDPglucose 6-dehydrogenase